MISFVKEWDESIPVGDREPEWLDRQLSHSEQRKYAYLTKIYPQLIAIIESISVALGRPSLAADMENDMVYARTNNIGVVETATRLLQLKAQFLYR
jgi:hypothetical protein